MILYQAEAKKKHTCPKSLHGLFYYCGPAPSPHLGCLKKGGHLPILQLHIGGHIRTDNLPTHRHVNTVGSYVPKYGHL